MNKDSNTIDRENLYAQSFILWQVYGINFLQTLKMGNSLRKELVDYAMENKLLEVILKIEL